MTLNDVAQPKIERAIAGFRELVASMSGAHAPEFPDPGVTMAQMKVLMLLSAIGEARMSDLAGRLAISLSTLSSLVDRLVEADHARRREDPRDRRNVLVSLTASGEELIDKFQELGVHQLRELMNQLADDEVRTVIEAIDLLVAAARRLPREDVR